MFQIPKAGNARLPSRLPLANRIDFNPKNLFANSEPGVWFEANDASTLFTDVAGTTPVTTPGDAVALQLDKSGRGNHRTQATTAARPLYALHPVGGVRNILTNTEEFDTRTVQVTPGEEYTLSFVSGESVVDLNETIASTAVDVFVYDTSKDSDGGAWRTGALAQASSWYNETLNTATRGSRREFPAVAVIVAEADKVTIYDGDDPALPMWMVFNQTYSPDGNLSWWRSSRPASSVSMFNSVLCLGQAETSVGGISLAYFASDALVGIKKLNVGSIVGLNISQRNLSANMVQTSDGRVITNNYVNDVAMTVLPDAPIDPATGLPVPTIAVATNGGVSVITDSGAVYDTTVGFTPVSKISFDSEGSLWWCRNSVLYLTYAKVTDYTQADGFGDLVASSIAGNQEFDLQIGAVCSDIAAAQSDGLLISGTGFGRHYLNTSSLVSSANTHLHAYTTSTYNTGWMNGDIKGAFLSDTDDTDLVGGELVTNGTFDTDLTGWTDFNTPTSTTVVSGEAEISGDAFDGIVQDITVVSGSTYVVSLDFTSKNGVVGYAIYSGANGTGTNLFNGINTPLGVQTNTVTATTNIFSIIVWSRDTSVTFKVDNISVKLADADRSVNNNGLTVNGTVSRDPVSSGADLVAYSGFSSSNYLEQPYNSDLDFGTGDFCVMGWVNLSNPAASQYIVDRYDAASGPRIALACVSSLWYFAASPSGGLSNTGVSNKSGWSFISLVRSSGMLYFYVDGNPVYSVANTVNLDNADAVFSAGREAGGSVSLAGSLALWRISATAPTAEQIAKIYNDEKVLFQENAQATLYGASDAVTALAHDPDTDLLHVGTSAGRSVFNGLLRINNTTTGVTTAISAANGVIGEQ